MAGIPTLKTGIQYLEHCKIHSRDGRLTYTIDHMGNSKHIAIPHANRVFLLLGPGTSVSQEASRKMSEENMLYGYTAGGGTPIFMASLNEYRPTEYLVSYMEKWLDPDFRLQCAKHWQTLRVEEGLKIIPKLSNHIDTDKLEKISNTFIEGLNASEDIQSVLGFEANYVKSLYALHARSYGIKNFKRDHTNLSDPLNKRITQGNYLAYGYAAVALWTLGIPASLPLTHGTTRRGGLVFDLADIFKSSIILPSVFNHYINDLDDSLARNQTIIDLDDHNALKKMFSIMKNTSKGELI